MEFTDFGTAAAAAAEPPAAAATEFQLFHVRECFIYKVPPLQSTGYRACEWDLANPALTGSLK